MALRTRGRLPRICETGIRTQQLYNASRLVAAVTGIQVAAEQGHRGAERLRPRGGHPPARDARVTATYEIMRPEDVGFTEHQPGARASTAAGTPWPAASRDLGYELERRRRSTRCSRSFKKLADKKKEIYDEDLEALLVSLFHQTSAGSWTLVSLTAASGTGTPPSAAVRLQRRGGRTVEEAATGDGPVDAVFKCIDRITGVNARLRDFRISSVSAGEDAQGEATVDVESEGRQFRGRAVRHRHRRRQRARLPRGGEPHRRRTAATAEPRHPRGHLWRSLSQTPRTLFDRIWEGHLVRPETAETPAVLFVDLHLVHEVTSPQAFAVLAERGPAGAPSRPDSGHDGPLDAHHSRGPGWRGGDHRSGVPDPAGGPGAELPPSSASSCIRSARTTRASSTSSGPSWA